MSKLVRRAKIIGTGSFTPDKIYSNKFLETIVDTNSEWIYKSYPKTSVDLCNTA